jgi:hypothetical protein
VPQVLKSFVRNARPRIALLCWLPLFASLCLFRANAQQLSVDVGGANLRYADTLNTSALLLSPTFQIRSARAAARALGTFAQLDAGAWTAQASVDAAWYTPARFLGPLLGEVSGSAGGSVHQDGARTGQFLGLVRVHTPGSRRGAWVGAGVGTTSDGDAWRSIRQAELGGWLRHSSASAMLTMAPTVVDDTIHYFDTEVRLGWERPLLEFNVVAGLRLGERSLALGSTDRAWGNASFIYWVKPWAGLLAGGGTYPVDLTQGFPGGRFFSLGLRFRRPMGRAPAELTLEDRVTEPAVVALSDGMDAFESMRASSGHYLLRIRVRGAQSVEIAADFTNWKPVTLHPAGAGWWTVSLPIAIGAHQMNARVNGGPWLVPPGLSVVEDEFGGRVGILNIAGDAAGGPSSPSIDVR